MMAPITAKFVAAGAVTIVIVWFIIGFIMVLSFIRKKKEGKET